MRSMVFLSLWSLLICCLGLKSTDIWRHFRTILKIPRCSANEAKMQGYIKDFARAHNLEVFRDSAHNLVVKRPGSGAGIHAEPVIVQTHLDMVCEKNVETKHDWSTDAILAVERAGWLVADNTTLGSDNGIGVALALALLEQPSTVTSAPLEALFTVEEETGLNGARDFDVSLISGRRLLNFDSEEWGIVYIGCAGGGDARINLPVQRLPLDQNIKSFQLLLNGLQGGHSGADIHEGRGNAVLLLGRAIDELRSKIPALRLLHFHGGNLDNAIPREGMAIIGVSPADLPSVQEALTTIQEDLKKEYGRIEPALALALLTDPATETESMPTEYFSDASVDRLLDLLRLLPHGVLKMSHEVPGLVETSNNVAAVRSIDNYTLEILCLARSSIGSAMESTHRTIARAAHRCGASVVRDITFPGWAPNRNQALLLTTEDAFEKVMGHRPNVTAIHAGLECGIIGDKVPGIEMVSLGPDIKGAHAPGERVHIESVEKLVVVVQELMAQLATDAAPKAEL